MSIAEPIRILSDLHLGHSGGKIENAAQLEPLIEGAGTIVFNGDTIEERADNYRPRSMELLADLEELCARLGATPIYINGNHDPSHWDHDYVDLADGKVFVTHGHVLLPYISPWSRNSGESGRRIDELRAAYSDDQLDDIETRFELTRKSCYAMNVYQPKLKPSVISKLRTFAAETWPPNRPVSILRTWLNVPRDAAQFLKSYRPDAEVIITGHTHFPGCWQADGKTVINLGAFFLMLNAQVVEISQGMLRYRSVVSRGGRFEMGRLKREMEVSV